MKLLKALPFCLLLDSHDAVFVTAFAITMFTLGKLLQTVDIQHKLKDLKVLEWLLSKIATEPEQQLQQLFHANDTPEKPSATYRRQPSPAAAQTAANRSSNSDGKPPASPAQDTADALVAADNDRAGAIYCPPSSPSTSTAKDSNRSSPPLFGAAHTNTLAEQSQNRSQAKRPLPRLSLPRVLSKPAATDKVPAAVEADDLLADSYRDENRPLTATRESPSPIGNEGDIIHPSFVPGDDVEEDLERLESEEKCKMGYASEVTHCTHCCLQCLVHF